MHERRQFVRLSARMKVTYRVVGSAGPYSSLTSNIGEGGLSLCTAKRLESGTVLQMAIMLPGTSRAIHIKAEVIWSGALLQHAGRGLAFETGVRFLKIDPNDRALVMRSAVVPRPHR